MRLVLPKDIVNNGTLFLVLLLSHSNKFETFFVRTSEFNKKTFYRMQNLHVMSMLTVAEDGGDILLFVARQVSLEFRCRLSKFFIITSFTTIFEDS